MALEHILLAGLDTVIGAAAPELGCYTGANNHLWCALDDLTAAFGGQGIFALLLSGFIITGGYVLTDGDLASPGVLVFLLGGILVPALPNQFQTLAQTIMFAGGVAAVMALFNRYTATPGI